jgi:hypothetical protein
MIGLDRVRHSGARLVLAWLAMVAVLLLCSVAWGADGPQEYIERAFVRQYALSDSSLWVDGDAGDQIRCFSVSLTDTTGQGVDQTYISPAGRKRNWRYLWRFAMPDSAQICDCFEISGSPDTLLWNNVRIPGKGFKEAANQFSTDSRGRLKVNRTVRADTLAASVIASKSAAGSVVSTDTLRVLMHARVASNLKVQGQTQLGNAVADTVKLIGNVRAQGSLTTQGTTTLGNAAADVITSKGAFTAEDDLTAGNDSTDVVRINGRLDLESTIYKEFTVTSGGGVTQAFTWTGARDTWRFVPIWALLPGTVRTLAAECTANDEVSIKMVTGAVDGTVGLIAIRPSY